MNLKAVFVISYLISLSLKVGIGKEKYSQLNFDEYSNWWDGHQNHDTHHDNEDGDGDDYGYDKEEEDKRFFESFDYESFKKKLAIIHPNKVKLYNQKLSSFQTI